MISGAIDISKEIQRLKTKREKLEGPLNRLKLTMAESDYLTKVPGDVQVKNSQEMARLQAEYEKISQELASMSLLG